MFLLEEFEYNCLRRNRETAARQLLECLMLLDREYGVLPDASAVGLLTPTLGREVDQHILTRLASAVSALLSDPEFHFAKEFQNQLFLLHRWLSAIFAASPFGNSDHLLRAFHKDGRPVDDRIVIDVADILKYCLLYSPNSEIQFDIDAVREVDPVLAVSLAIALISPRFLGTAAAHGKREALLPWLARRLPDVEDVDQIPVGVLHDVYMHCSYADRPDKHDVKRAITGLVRRKLLDVGFVECTRSVSHTPDRGAGSTEKPVMVVLLEWFTAGHSIYRTHSLTLEAARRQFHVVGLGYERCTDAVTRAVFDEFVPLAEASLIDQMSAVSALCEERGAQILYMPSVGMFPITMFAASVRSAPLQFMALGHPATTHSPAIDRVVVEEDYVGDPACFSEALMVLPRDGMPYRPSAFAADLPARKPDREPCTVRIAICATTMKLNPRFLETCAEIAKRAWVPVQFHFLIGQAQGLIYPQVRRMVEQYLGDAAVVYRHQPYDAYMQVIAGCDMFLNPFPFGNTNGVIDTVSAGLVGVCLTGPEVHEHIDQGLFERLCFPRWTIARNRNAYINAAVRMIGDHEERAQIERDCSGPDKLHRIFSGRAEVMAEMFVKAMAEAAQPG